MTRPGEFDDIGEAVTEEWTDETTTAERVRESVKREYIGVTAGDVAETARTSTETAKTHLDAFADAGFVRVDTGDAGVPIYRRDPRSLVFEQTTEILENTSMDELTARVQDMRDRVSEFQAEHDAESPEAAAKRDDSDAIREWTTTRRNLAFANAALAIAEATRVIDEDELERRRRASEMQIRRMFRDKPAGPHYPVEPVPDEIDEEELEAEVEELEAELEDELDDDE